MQNKKTKSNSYAVTVVEKGLVINLKLMPNPELVQLILSYGADVKVLKPESLQAKIKQALELGRKLHE